PNGTVVGFSGINGDFRDSNGYNEMLYRITKITGILAIAVAGGFAVLGAWQLFTRKSVKKVDPEIILLGGFYVIVILLYLLFNVAVINYRPMIEPGETAPEASYPSSHSVLAVCVFVTAGIVLLRYIKNRTAAYAACAALNVLAIFTVIGRALSGVHWLTDIIGGLILSAALVALYYAALKYVRAKLAANKTE
ncbi:MAG: phosphatase PAP2 family protein, partial [Clostridia bacterium]|nr:phosphatase PAP2 family protein [Clostridia bacterium]